MPSGAMSCTGPWTWSRTNTEVMMDRLLVVPLERDLENAEPLVFEKDFVLFRRRGYGVQCRIPARRVRIRTIGCHDSLLPD